MALFNGFVVIAALDLGAPGWLAAVIGVAVAGAGHVGIRVAKTRLVPRPRTETPTSQQVDA